MVCLVVRSGLGRLVVVSIVSQCGVDLELVVLASLASSSVLSAQEKRGLLVLLRRGERSRLGQTRLSGRPVPREVSGHRCSYCTYLCVLWRGTKVFAIIFALKVGDQF